MTSTRRRAPSAYDVKLDKSPEGRSLCRRCKNPVPKGRQTFCGNECVHEWRIRTDPGYVRLKVFERDKGVCAKCGRDTMVGREGHYRIRARGTGHLWQADHITPVIEGGGECGLDNYRTLCSDCHKAETAALARRRAEARKADSLQEVMAFA